MRVLLTEGSGLTSRQVAGRLGTLGHEVEILSSTPLCLGRFTHHVRAVHAVPRFGVDPFAWLEAAERIARARKIDLLFPTQEQVAVLSARRDALSVATIVPPFPALARVQDKVSAHRTLDSLGLPQPETVVLSSVDDIAGISTFPVFIKRPVSTASSGVVRAATRREAERAARALGLGTGPLAAQAQVEGPLAMVQAVADHGRLVACHANLRLREGIGGGASLKESIAVAGLRDLLARLVETLAWHGGLSMDVILAPNGPTVIDVNPRLVEPGNALASGVDLVAAMLDVAGARNPPETPPGRDRVRTRQALIGILGAAEREGTRIAVAREAWAALLCKGAYSGSHEELTPISRDPLAFVPVVAALAATILSPGSWRRFHGGAVGTYALTPEGWRRILEASANDRKWACRASTPGAV